MGAADGRQPAHLSAGEGGVGSTLRLRRLRLGLRRLRLGLKRLRLRQRLRYGLLSRQKLRDWQLSRQKLRRIKPKHI